MADDMTTPSADETRDGLAAARALRTLADRLEEIYVEHAREREWSWQDIARELELSRQAVHQRYGSRDAARTRKDTD